MDPLDELVGESRAIESVKETIRRLMKRRPGGGRPPCLLIQGETGTGKGLVARLLHRVGPRSSGRFVDVNCAAIPDSLLESELFGYERGAFTDARRAKPGLFQTAHQGTIFLDEIALLPEALQAKLLTVIEDRAVRRLGGTHAEAADAWIISATNADLQAAVRDRRFRQDLYHRLAVLTLKMPPLRERGRDILLLAERVLARVCAEYGLAPKTLAPDARERLLAYPWPGNVRELGNVIERAALLGEGPTLTAAQLELRGTPPTAAPAAAAGAPAPAVSLDESMSEHLRSTLEKTNWNISRAAALLGISRNTLRARIEKFGLRGGPAPGPPPARGTARATTAAPAAAEPAAPARAQPTSAIAASSAIRWEARRLTLLRAVLIPAKDEGEVPDTSRALDFLLDKLRSFGGRIEELSPRAVGAVFGLEPVEDAPRRAAHAALAILKAAERGRRGEGEPFTAKVGIHVGQVLVGQSPAGVEIDADAERAQWSVLDSLLAQAPPDSIRLSPAAAPFLERRFDLTPERGLPAFRLEGRERKGLALEGEMAWFVGRRQELDLLKSRLGSARAGRGQIVGIVGEAGIGKSRLLYEFRQALRGEAITYVEGHCLSYGSTIPYLPALEIVRHACRITDADAPETVTRKLRVTLDHLGLDPGESLSYLLQFLGIKDVADAAIATTPEAIQARTVQILRQMCVSASRQRPLILAVEDAHWIDPASEALASIMDSLEAVPLLLVLTYRPGYRPPWLEKSHMTQIALQPLSPEDSLTVLGGILPSPRLSDPIARLILSKADGNPFFLEELGRTVREQGALSPSGAVPDTVQEVLLARINRLPDRERRLLQSAAVIGKNVSVDLLRGLAELSEEALGEALSLLRAGDFLYEGSTGSDVQYSFKHALTHEVAYGSLRLDRRRELHARIVEAIEGVHHERLIEHVERLAHHSARGELWDKAVKYLRQAGVKAAAHSAHPQAAAYFEQALDILQRRPRTGETMAQAIDLRFDLRNSLHPLGEFERILDHLREAEALAKALPDQGRLAWVFSFMSQYHRLNGHPELAIDSGQRACAIAEHDSPSALWTVATMCLGSAYWAVGKYRQAVEVLTSSVESAPGPSLSPSVSVTGLPVVFARIYLVCCLAELGEFSAGVAHGAEAIRVAEAADQPYTCTFAYYGVGTLFQIKGDIERAIPMLERGLRLCRDVHLPIALPLLASSLGPAYALSGRVDEGIALLEEGATEAVSMKRIGGQSMIVTRLGQAYLLAGRVDEAAESAARALELARGHQERGCEAYALHLLGEIASRASSPDIEAAATFYRQATALAEELGMRPLRARCELGLGRLYGRADQRDNAASHLAAAIAAFRALDMPFWLEQARAELAALA
jgi:transcriptional regulator with AAA-type ATPase domain/tetratricopeptide (TPR) repeat protein